ncbi:MAG TPA: hypothetical protein VFP84_28440 [Kofleriaceae bacterium]|nr:hypothetical protein [Kofleriaceae bacterium]
MTIHSIPQARVVRKAGQVMAPPPVPPDEIDDGTALSRALRTSLSYAVGMWPLTCVVLLMIGLLILAANNASY